MKHHHLDELRATIAHLKHEIEKTDPSNGDHLKVLKRDLAQAERHYEEMRPRYYVIIGHCECQEDEAHFISGKVSKIEALSKVKVLLDPDDEYTQDQLHVTQLLASDCAIEFVTPY